MVDGSFIDALGERLLPQVTVVDPAARLVVADGHKVVDSTVHKPAALEVNTLTAIRDYLAAMLDVFPGGGKVMLHVVGPVEVNLIGALEDERTRFRRSVYLTAKARTGGFQPGRYQGVEEFIGGLRSQFVESKEREDLLALVGSIRGEAV
jgi:hypothetical protein